MKLNLVSLFSYAYQHILLCMYAITKIYFAFSLLLTSYVTLDELFWENFLYLRVYIY